MLSIGPHTRPMVFWLRNLARYFHRLSSGAGMYYAIPEISLDGDFKVTFNAEPTGSAIRPLGAAGNFSNNIELTANLLTTDTSGTTSSVSGTFNIQEDKYSLWEIERVGTDITYKINGSLLATSTGSTGSLVIDTINNISGFYADGIIANAKIYDNGTLVLDMPLDESLIDSAVIRNRAATLGAEIINDTPANWTPTNADVTFPSGRIRITNTANSQGSVTFALNQSIGDTILTGVFNKTHSGPNGEAWVSNPYQGVSEDSLMVTTALTNTGSLTLRCNGTSIGDWVEYDLPSAKNAPGYGMAINSPESKKFKQVADGWEGEELIENANFDDDSWWTTGAYTTIQNGRAEFDDTALAGSSENYISRSNLLEAGLVYRNRLTMSNYVNGALNLTAFGAAFPDNVLSSNGEHTVTGSSATTLHRVRRNDSGSTNIFNLDNVSCKEFLENA